ncbi:MAG: hypothetical protein HY720_28930 [Planctomycetes bacterium]|nr:hypothetical protein [Planctomycetota bacterium]
MFWLGAIVPPVGAALSLAAFFERWRRRLLPSPARIPAALFGLAPTLWLGWWSWEKATGPGLALGGPGDAPFLDPASLGLAGKILLVSALLHFFLGALCGALWGARTAPAGRTIVRAGVGAISGSGWAWCAAGAYFVVRQAILASPIGVGMGVAVLAIPLASLILARQAERTRDGALDWSRVAD